MQKTELIYHDNGLPFSTSAIRLKVPGGWVVTTCMTYIILGELKHLSQSSVFVPDEHHGWFLIENGKMEVMKENI